ncbi:hypothetical protein ZIOFF_033531 [Zingiber officinale]|uniref:GATA-type domain-containing protein n=1 Tax=Zingiber officinale TaxID=94328 RepID=A0A8J5LCA2_ZINOF|nr:hypothetical protein ZIOFF_033531 [Zingiber officinale]
MTQSSSLLGTRAPPKKAAKRNEPAGLTSANERRCVHFWTDKTPQWRTGPMGPKKLYSACIARFKSSPLQAPPSSSPSTLTPTQGPRALPPKETRPTHHPTSREVTHAVNSILPAGTDTAPISHIGLVKLTLK